MRPWDQQQRNEEDAFWTGLLLGFLLSALGVGLFLVWKLTH